MKGTDRKLQVGKNYKRAKGKGHADACRLVFSSSDRATDGMAPHQPLAPSLSGLSTSSTLNNLTIYFVYDQFMLLSLQLYSLSLIERGEEPKLAVKLVDFTDCYSLGTPTETRGSRFNSHLCNSSYILTTTQSEFFGVESFFFQNPLPTSNSSVIQTHACPRCNLQRSSGSSGETFNGGSNPGERRWNVNAMKSPRSKTPNG